MVKVMIVDDEILVRIGLRSTISWEEFGFIVISDAANGMQAIEKFNAADPDILITDIRMPGMDGIELVKILKQKKPSLKTVILTNYDNFEYAKQALELGADDYLLKTALDNHTLFPVLQKLQTKIARETEESLQYQQLQQIVLRGLSYLKKQFAENLLMGKINPEEWLNLLKELNLKWERQYFLLALVKGRVPIGESRRANLQSLQLIEEIVEKIHGALVWELPNTLQWGIIYSFAPEEQGNYSKQVIPFNIRQVKSCLKQYLHISTVAVTSRAVQDYTQLSSEWQNLVRFTDYCIFHPERELFNYEDIPEHLSEIRFSFNAKNLSHLVKLAELDKVRELLDKLFAEVTDSFSPALLRQVWHELLGEIFRLARENGLRLTGIMSNEEQDSDYLDCFHSIPEIKEWFFHKFSLLIRQIEDSSIKIYSPVIRNAITYLEEHYSQDIPLMLLANRVGLSKNHFCTLFHSETGRNFVDYLHQIRIEHACELLETTDLRVSEVGQKAGYGDPKYFTKVFQKYKNCSPSEYREKDNY